MTTPTTARHLADPSSPFAGADVCGHAGLALPDGAGRPVFDHDLWDFSDVIGLPVQMPRYQRRFDFTVITHPGWRLVAKELVLAMLARSTRRLPCCRRPTAHPCTCAAAQSGLTSSPGCSPGSDTMASAA
jgi:hypothetical protein